MTWSLVEDSLDLAQLAPSESRFALSNGHIGMRGNLDEGEPHGIPGVYLGGFHELRDLPYAEAGYGYPESGQSIVPATNGQIMRLLVGDEPLDVRYGSLLSHTRELDFQSGLLTRSLVWQSPAGMQVRVRSQRLVSFTHRAVAAIAYEVEALQDGTRIVLQSELVANQPQPAASSDPRVAATLESCLAFVSSDQSEAGATLLHRTRKSDLLSGAGMDHEVIAETEVATDVDVREDWARVAFGTTLQQGQTLRVVKLIAYGWSAARSEPAIRDQVAAALMSARSSGWDGLVSSQRAFLDDFWNGADVVVEGDDQLQQAVRFGLFHVLQAGARAERRAIASKGLTGPGYDGHAFWDTEGFVLPVLMASLPTAARDALLWRHSILEQARGRAHDLGLAGAAFAWRTISGCECSAYWPAGTAAFHINADIAYAVERYRAFTGDADFDRDYGTELLVETARLWVSLGHHDRAGGWHIDGVTGPDEYSALADDNLFTNVMAAFNLSAAVAACGRWPAVATALKVTAAELETWRDAAASVAIPYDDELGVHEQSSNFTRYRDMDFTAASYPLFLHMTYGQLYSTQVIKQTDLALAMHWRSALFTPEQKARNVDYYERITVRDSSLSACTQAVLCAEVGHLDLAYAYAREAALIDVRDLAGNTANGLHLASLGGAWSAMVEGFGGLRLTDGALTFDPALPAGLSRLTFRLRWRGAVLSVGISAAEATFATTHALELVCAGTTLSLGDGESAAVPLTARVALLPEPTQPPGRAPSRAW